jgi:uncharacterized phage protein (TIGR02218 family)
VKSNSGPDYNAFLQDTVSRNAFRVDLFTIGLVNGTEVTATSGQIDVQANGKGFYARAFGRWQRAATIRSSVGLSSQETSLRVIAKPDLTAPGTNGLVNFMAAVNGGLFEAATVTIQTAFMQKYGDLSAGVETKFSGFITDIQSVTRTEAVFKVNDWNYLLNTQVPWRLITPACNWNLYSAGCGLTRSQYGSKVGVAGGNQTVVYVSVPPVADGYYSEGVLQFTAGANAGLSYSIKTQVGGTLTLNGKTLATPGVGDTAMIYAGCDHQMSTCQTKFNNLGNFSGSPFVPVPETAI